MSNKTTSILIWVIFLILIVITPIIIEKVILKSNIMSGLGKEQVITFWGNYASAILRSIMSMLGVMLTIRYYLSKDKKDENRCAIKERKLIEYYFEFLEALNEFKVELKEKNDYETINAIWKRCENIYNFKVIIGTEIDIFEDYSRKIRLLTSKYKNEGQAWKEGVCLEIVEELYEYSKIILFR